MKKEFSAKDLKVVLNQDMQEIRYKGIVNKVEKNWVLIDPSKNGWQKQGWVMDGIVFDKIYKVKEYFKNKIDN